MKYPIKMLMCVLVAGVAFAWSTPARAVECGDFTYLGDPCVDTTVVLETDLVCTDLGHGNYAIDLMNESSCWLTLDCQGNSIVGGGEGMGSAVRVSASSRVAVQNCNIDSFDDAINISEFSYGKILGNIFTNNMMDLDLLDASSMTIEGNEFLGVEGHIRTFYGSMLIYNNIFLLRTGFDLDLGSKIELYVEPEQREAPNIAGGPWTGGNAYMDIWENCKVPYPNPYENSFCAGIIVDGHVDKFPLQKFADDPVDILIDLTATVVKMEIENEGTVNSLEKKVVGALEALEAAKKNDKVVAKNKITAFENEVEAQRGNKLTHEQADTLKEKSAAAKEAIDKMP
jgi:hypothetical protein